MDLGAGFLSSRFALKNLTLTLQCLLVGMSLLWSFCDFPSLFFVPFFSFPRIHYGFREEKNPRFFFFVDFPCLFPKRARVGKIQKIFQENPHQNLPKFIRKSPTTFGRLAGPRISFRKSQQDHCRAAVRKKKDKKGTNESQGALQATLQMTRSETKGVWKREQFLSKCSRTWEQNGFWYYFVKYPKDPSVLKKLQRSNP